jgi:hypothetical protein
MKKKEIKTRVDTLILRNNKGLDITTDLEILSLELELSILRCKTNLPKVGYDKKQRKTLVRKATEMRKKGMSVRDIGTELNVPKTTIGRWTKGIEW